VAHLVFDFAKLTEFLLRIILAVNCGYGTNGWRSSAFTKEFMAMTCMIWGSCLSEYLFAFLHDTHDTHAYLAAHHSDCLGNTRYWTDYTFPFFATSTHAAHHRLYSKLFNLGWAILFSRHWLTLHITVPDAGVTISSLSSFGRCKNPSLYGRGTVPA